MDEVNFIDDGHDGEFVFHRRVSVGDRLCFDALKGINQQEGPFAASQRPRDFVLKINVPGGIDQIQLVSFAVFLVRHRHRTRA